MAATVQFYLRADDKPLFAVFHPAQYVAGPSVPPRTAVLMLGAWGAEDMSSHRSWRGLAETLATAGYPTLRLDLDGCGDSHDLQPDTDHWSAWQTSVAEAIKTLQGLGGVQHITLVGLRLGALLAATVSASQDDVCNLVLVAPVRSGKAYLRELRMLGGAMAQGRAGQEGGLFAAGFELNAPTVAAIGRATLPDTLHASAVTVVDRDDLGIGKAWLAKLADSGVVTTHTAQPGFQDMVLTAHKAKPALAIFAKVVEAVEQGAARRADPRHDPPAACCQDLAQCTQSLRVNESVLAPYGPMAMTGVLVAPGDGVPRSGRGLLILNSSAERRIGPNRMWVRFARERAALGDVVVRVDMPGLGESGSAYKDGVNVVYPEEAVDCLRLFLGHLRAQQLAVHWGVMGLCSGGYHSFRLGVADSGIERVFALNTFGLLPAEVADFDARTEKSLQHAVAHNLVSHLSDGQRWLKLLRGNVDVGLILRALSSRAWYHMASFWDRIGVRWGWLPTMPLTQELKALGDRHSRVHFIFSTTDPGPTIVRESTGNAVVSMMLAGSVTEDLVDDADHVFAGIAGRSQMLEYLHRRLDQWTVRR